MQRPQNNTDDTVSSVKRRKKIRPIREIRVRKTRALILEKALYCIRSSTADATLF